MERLEWQFKYPCSTLAPAALEKYQHHTERLAYWQRLQEEVMTEVRSKGLEIDEGMAALAYGQFSAASSVRGAKVVVKSEYQERLNECHHKIETHSAKAKEYDAWYQVLNASADQEVPLNFDDYLFFFGK